MLETMNDALYADMQGKPKVNIEYKYIENHLTVEVIY